MKEEIALTKICPIRSKGGLACKGSACMLWEPEYSPEKLTIETDLECFSRGEYRNGQMIEDGWILECQSTFCKTGEKPRIILTLVKFFPNGNGDCGLRTKENGCFYPG